MLEQRGSRIVLPDPAGMVSENSNKSSTYKAGKSCGQPLGEG